MRSRLVNYSQLYDISLGRIVVMFGSANFDVTGWEMPKN